MRAAEVLRWASRAPARLFVLFAAFLLAFPAQAQDLPVGAPAPPMPSSIDARGVDLLSGKLVQGAADLSIGPQDNHGLRFGRQWVDNGWRLADVPTMSGSTANPVVSFGGHSIPFRYVSGAYVPEFQDGSTLSSDLATFTASDGTVITFDYAGFYVSAIADAPLGVGTQVTFPDGTVRTFHYNTFVYQDQICVPIDTFPYGCQVYTFSYHVARLSAITSSTGYEIKLDFAQDTITELQDLTGPWVQITRATAINNDIEYCDPEATSCSLTNDWPHVSYADWASGDIGSVTDPENRTTSYTYDTAFPAKLTAIRAPGESTDTVAYEYNTNGQVSSVTTAGSTWSYAYNTGSTTVTDPLSHDSSIAYSSAGLVASVTDSTNRTTTYDWCPTGGDTGCPEGLLKTVTMPEGNKVTYAYDARGNTTSQTSIAKTGSGLANIGTAAAYPSSCSNVKTCNQPSSTTDAGGNVTNYTYASATGALTKVEAPAVGGQRATINYIYTTKQSRYLTGSSTWSNSSVTVLTETNTCRTAAACNGTANEARTLFSYPASSVANNLQLVSIEHRSGDGALSSTTTLAYDNLGRVSTVDGPLAGTNDKAAIFYDAGGAVIGKIGADPDGSGGNPRPAVRYTYNTKGQLVTTESGTVTALTQAALNSMSPSFKSTRTYDANRRLKTEAQVATSGTTQYGVTQYSYDALGRPTCTAVRMNAPTTGTTLPASACTAMTAGTYGADRITQQVYDAAGRVTGVLSGVGTPLSQTTAAYSYTSNGRVQTVTDASGNKTTYTYDGFDRPLKTQYPSKTTAGQSNNSDYELLTYGTSGNEKGRVTGLRNRMGESFGFSHDNLGRTTHVTVPERTGLDTSFTQDVDYAYNVAGDMLSATFDTTGDPGIAYTYDAFGRPVSTTNSMFSSAKMIGYGYDVAGNRTSVTHPDSVAFTYVYDAAGRLTGIKLGTTQLATFAFDPLGRLSTESRYSSAPGKSYGYDAAGRLSSLAITGAGSNSASWGYTYNPAGEVISTTRDNDLYAYTGNANVNRDYASNGLNQYDTVGADPVSYDANGNLANDNHTAFTYDPQNLLVSASGGNSATLHYDPLGRLFEVNDGTSTTQFLYDGDDLVGEYNSSGTLLDRYVHGAGAGDDPILGYAGATTADTALRQLYADRLGSVVLTTDSAGALTGRGAYDEWGVPDLDHDAGVGAGGVGRFGYTGQVWLPELGMSYYKARMYSPVLGRFMQTDPIGYGDGMNMYRYAGNNSVNGVDPSGLDTRYCSNDPYVPGSGSPCGVGQYCQVTGSLIQRPCSGADAAVGWIAGGSAYPTDGVVGGGGPTGSWVYKPGDSPPVGDSGQIVVNAGRWIYANNGFSGLMVNGNQNSGLFDALMQSAMFADLVQKAYSQTKKDGKEYGFFVLMRDSKRYYSKTYKGEGRNSRLCAAGSFGCVPQAVYELNSWRAQGYAVLGFFHTHPHDGHLSGGDYGFASIYNILIMSYGPGSDGGAVYDWAQY